MGDGEKEGRRGTETAPCRSRTSLQPPEPTRAHISDITRRVSHVTAFTTLPARDQAQKVEHRAWLEPSSAIVALEKPWVIRISILMTTVLALQPKRLRSPKVQEICQLGLLRYVNVIRLTAGAQGSAQFENSEE